MKIDLLDEPELEFGLKHRDIDIRRGIRTRGAFDSFTSEGPREIRVGVVGTVETIEGVCEWLNKCRSTIAAKASNQPNLYTWFPGFNADVAFHSKLVHESSWFGHVKIPQIEVKGFATRNQFVDKLTLAYEQEIRELAQKKDLSVIICAPSLRELEAMRLGNKRRARHSRKRRPTETRKAVGNSGDTTDVREEDEGPIKFDFHDLLKARAMSSARPIQIVLPATYDETKNNKQKALLQREMSLQDEATRAWNFFTALYYKATGTPWRLVREASEPATCYIGISFFRTLDQRKTYASSAQVFNERGEGVIVRGGEARYSKDDRAVYLDRETAVQLLHKALTTYRHEHSNYPARVVLHKTSKFMAAEIEGFSYVLVDKEIDYFDFITMDDSFARLFRTEDYPPVRGTWLELEEDHCLLYTCGSVPYYETYRGKYPPRTLRLNRVVGQRPIRQLAQETLGLTKMNWNSTDFDELFPITIRAAKQVGSILKYLEETNDNEIRQFYRFYM